MAFDPGMRVERREALPPMEQALGEQITTVAPIPCQKDEADEACLARAEREMASAFPDAIRYESSITAEQVVLATTLEIDGRPTETTFASAAELERRLAELVAAGHEVKVKSGRTVPAPDARRDALVKAVLPARESARSTLRIRMLLPAPDDPIRAIFEIQQRAAEAGIVLHLVERRDDGALDVEIGCVRAASESP